MTSAADGSRNVPVFDGPERKSMSTRPTRPPPNSIQHDAPPSYGGGGSPPRTPRALSASCKSSAVSLGASGHLYGALQTPMTMRPAEKDRTAVVSRPAPATE